MTAQMNDLREGRHCQPPLLLVSDCWPARLFKILADQQDRLRFIRLADNACLPQRSTRMRRIIDAEIAVLRQDYEGNWSELASAFGSQFVDDLRTATEDSSFGKATISKPGSSDLGSGTWVTTLYVPPYSHAVL